MFDHIYEFFDKASNLAFWIIGIVFLLIAFAIGGFLGVLIKGFVRGIGRAIPIYINRSLTDLVLRGIVVIIAIVLCIKIKLPFGEILDSITPVGSFDEITRDLFGDTNQYVMSNAISAGWNQFILTFISFFPLFIITEIIDTVKSLICHSDDEPYYGFISFIPDFLTVLSANVIVMFMGDSLPRMQLEFLNGIKLEFGFVRFIILGLLVFIYIYYVISDMLSSDVFVTMMSANIAAAILSVDLTGRTRTIILVLTVVMGYGLKVAKSRIIANAGGDDDSASILLVPLFGLISTVVAGGLFLIIFKIMGF
ncbi:MAG: hypothetical protein IJ017_06205 [Oscillospiraceae bacterium]|nr:hypothetical protein [Oscillospiraceae bacterium]